MKLGMHVLHINTQRGISRIFEFRNIFRKTLFFRNLFGLRRYFSLPTPQTCRHLYIRICHPYSITIHWCLNIDTYIHWHPYSIHWYLNIDTYIHWHPYSIHWYLKIETYAFALMLQLIIEHWYLYTLAPIQYTLILEHWDLCICTYGECWYLNT